MELKSLPDQLFSNLKKIEELNVRGCGLKGLPSSLGNLTELTKLDLAENMELKSLPDQLFSNLKKIKELDVRGCGLNGLPSSLGNLTELTKLDLAGNKELKSLPDQFSNLKKLEKLNVSGCGLKHLPFNFGNLFELRHLDLSECSLTRLPLSVCDLDKLTWFRVDGNPLTVPPPQVCKQGIRAVQAYFALSQKEKLNRFKLIILGEPCSGKTSLIKTMIRKIPSLTKVEDRTVGVKEHDLVLRDEKKAKVLDCGGQKCYQLTNQLFVGENALIVIAVDVKEYQLTKDSFIQHIGRYLQVIYDKSRSNQVVIAFTKIDSLFEQNCPNQTGSSEICSSPELLEYQRSVVRELENFRRSRLLKLEKMSKTVSVAKSSFLRNQNISVYDKVIFTSAMQTDSVERLEQLIDELSEDRALFPTVEHMIPTVWLNFEERILEECSGKQLSIMKLQNVIELASHHELVKEHVWVVLLYCHQVGTLLFFHRHHRLSGVVFGSSETLMNVFKLVFCHSHSEHKFQECYGKFYNSPQTFHADREQLVKYGTMTIAMLKTLLSSLNLDDHCLNIVVNLLLTFDFVYVKPDPNNFSDTICYPHWNVDELSLDQEKVTETLERNNARLLVPWLLKEDCPTHVSKKFPEECPSHWIEVTISFSFVSCVPLGIFHQFSARCHHHSHLIYHWESGFMLRYGPVLAQVTCQSEDGNPWIHCRGRVPKSNKALQRLFHVLWRCVVELEMLLKTVPGCLFELFMEYNDGDEKSSREKINIFEVEEEKSRRFSYLVQKRAIQWKLRAADSESVTVDRCSKAVDTVSQSMSEKLPLREVFPQSLGREVNSDDLKKVAKEISSSDTDVTSLLAVNLDMDQDFGNSLNDRLRMLRQWKKEREKGAILAVLVDALEESGLNTTEIYSLPPRVHSMQLQNLEVPVNKEMMEIVSRHCGENEIYPFGRQLLDVGNVDVENVIARAQAQDRCPSEKAYVILEAWFGQEGPDATLETLLRVCDHPGVKIKGKVVKGLKKAGYH